MRTKHHMWTKDEIKKVTKLWESNSVETLAEEMGVKPNQLYGLIVQMRKAGFNLIKKHRKGYLLSLLKEVKAEMK